MLTLEELDRLCGAFVRQGVQQAAPHRRRAAGAAQHHEPVPRARPPSRDRRARRTHAHHQWQPARPLCRGPARRRRARGSTSRSTRSTPQKFTAITRWGKLDQVLDGIDAAQARRARDQDQHRRAQRRQRGRVRPTSSPGAASKGFDLTLIEAMPMGEIGGDARLDQYLPLSLVRARLQRALDARRDRLPHRRAGALLHACARPAGGSASSRRSRIISAKAATACG